MSKLTVDIKVGEILRIGNTSVQLVKKSGQLARLVIDADQDTPIKTPARKSVPSDNTEIHTHG